MGTAQLNAKAKQKSPRQHRGQGTRSIHLIKARPVRALLTTFHLPPRPYRAEHDLPLAERVRPNIPRLCASSPRQLRVHLSPPLFPLGAFYISLRTFGGERGWLALDPCLASSAWWPLRVIQIPLHPSRRFSPKDLPSMHSLGGAQQIRLAP
ncbi:hypothetical protein C8J57DRAFT_1620581 [Mycena rebaudengoi]|nr:hypothetical protein C8J57DRAFT_1620581 [Mycena rebaudengoi]